MSSDDEAILDVPAAESVTSEEDTGDPSSAAGSGDSSSAEASGDDTVPAGPAAQDEETEQEVKQQKALQKAIEQAEKAARDAIKTLQPPMLDIADDDLEELCNSIRSLYCGDSDAKNPGPTRKNSLEPAVYETYRLIRDTLQNRRYISVRVQKAIEMINCTLKMSDAFGTGETSVPIEKLKDYIKSRKLKDMNVDPSNVAMTGVAIDEETATIHIMQYLSDPEQYDHEAYNENNRENTKKFAPRLFNTLIQIQTLSTQVVALKEGGKIPEVNANKFLSDVFQGIRAYLINDKKNRRLEPERRIKPLTELHQDLQTKLKKVAGAGWLTSIRNSVISNGSWGLKKLLKILGISLVYSVLAFAAVNTPEDIQDIFFGGKAAGQPALDSKTFSVLGYLWYFYGNFIKIVGGPMQAFKNFFVQMLTPLLSGATTLFAGQFMYLALGVCLVGAFLVKFSPNTIATILTALLKSINVIFFMEGSGSLAGLIFTAVWWYSLSHQPIWLRALAATPILGKLGLPTWVTGAASLGMALVFGSSWIPYIISARIFMWIMNNNDLISNKVRKGYNGVIKFANKAAQLIKGNDAKEDAAFAEFVRDPTDRIFFTRKPKDSDYQHVDNLPALRLIDEIMNQTLNNTALYGPLHNTLRQHKAFIIGKQTDAKLLPQLNNRILTAGLGQQPARITQLMGNFGGHGHDKNIPKITPGEFYTIGLFMSTRVRTRAEHLLMLLYFTEAAYDGHVDAMNYILMYYDEHPDVNPRGKEQYIQQLKARHQEPPMLQIGYLENEQRQLYRDQLTTTYETMEDKKDIANAIVMLANNSQDYRILLLNETSPARLIKAILNALALEGKMMFTRIEVLSKTTPDDLLGTLQAFGSQLKIKFLNSIQDGKALLRHLHTELWNARAEEKKTEKIKKFATLEAIFVATAGGLGEDFVGTNEFQQSEPLPKDKINQRLRDVAFYMSNTESLYNMATYQGNGKDKFAFTSTSDVLGYYAAKGRIIAERQLTQLNDMYSDSSLSSEDRPEVQYYRAVSDAKPLSL